GVRAQSHQKMRGWRWARRQGPDPGNGAAASAVGASRSCRCRRCLGVRDCARTFCRNAGKDACGARMIGRLNGVVDSTSEDHAIIDVGGVGYLVHCPSSTLSKLHAGAGVALMIETKVSEDAIRLYGFSTAEEREWFRLLQNVQNVGARVALNVLSALSSRELERAIALGDKAAIGRAQGVGPKLATRIVTELKDKAPAMMLRGHAD